MAPDGRRRILLPVNRPHGYEEALRLAQTLIRNNRGRGDGGKIHAIYVIEAPLEYPVDAELDHEISKGEEALAYIEYLAKVAHCPLEAEILQARIAGPAIVQEAANIPADMIVMGVDAGDPVTGFQLGRTAGYVLKNAPCPVALWRASRNGGGPPQGGL